MPPIRWIHIERASTNSRATYELPNDFDPWTIVSWVETNLPGWTLVRGFSTKSDALWGESLWNNS